MAMWRCPHCGTPQPEAARCWVCRRSSTTCSTCWHFCQSLAPSVGYCGLDRRRAPLHGTEHRGCWEPAAGRSPLIASAVVDVPLDGPEVPADGGPGVARLRPASRSRPGVLEGFVPIELASRGPRSLRATDRAPVPPPTEIEASESWAERETLFGDA